MRNRLLGVAVIILGCTFALGQAQYKVIYDFGTNQSAGPPTAGLVLDAKGNLYGTTAAQEACPPDCGTVFELTPLPNGSWVESVIYSFCSQPNCADGASPNGQLTFDAAGNLYGSTSRGPNVFELTPLPEGGWIYSVIYSFTDGGTAPGPGLIFDHAGNLYGSASGGLYRGGMVFELTPSEGDWTRTVLYNFCSQPNCSDGKAPLPLAFDPKGNIYGMTEFGGAKNLGTVFEMWLQNGVWTEQVIRSCGSSGMRGIYPTGGLIVDLHGDLFGATESGGSYEDGVAFELASTGSGFSEYSYSFDGADGISPDGGLVQVKSSFFGVAGGAAYELVRQGTGAREIVLYAFPNCTNGCGPLGPLVASGNHLYGVAGEGGTYNLGVVFEITP